MAEVTKYSPAIYLDKFGHEGCRARVFLYGEDEKFLGTISFHDPGQQQPNTVVGPAGQLFTSCSFGIYDDVIDLLRHESPVFYGRIAGSARLECSLEPAGESET